MKLLLIILALVIVSMIIWHILKTGKAIDQEKTTPNEIFLSTELELDDDHTFENVMAKTWEYFDANPAAEALTEIHSIVYDRSCLVTETLDENGSRLVIVTFIIDDDYQLPDYPKNTEGQPEVIFRGSSAHSRAEETIKNVLKVTDESRVSYQLAGSDGPEHYFEVIQ